MPIDWNKPVQTRDGRKVRILCTDGPARKYPVVGFIEGEDCPITWSLDGQYRGTFSNIADLINVPAEPVTMWVVLASCMSGSKLWAVPKLYKTEQAARDDQPCAEHVCPITFRQE